MTDLATYSRSGPVGTIVMDDGKANVMSLAMLNALHAAFDQAEKDKAVVILKARGKHFSGGFDLNVFAKGSAEDQYLMLKAGAELALRILSFPTPVVAACQGNAYPMGAFLIMSSDHRIAAEGDYRIGMNEVAIGLTVPRFAIEIARQRLTPAYFSRVVDDGGNVRPDRSRHRRFLRPCGPGGRAGAQRRGGRAKARHAQHGGPCRHQGAGAGGGDQDDPRHDRRGHHAAIWRGPRCPAGVGLRRKLRPVRWRCVPCLCMKEA